MEKYDELSHYGVLGMKWGVRKARSGASKKSSRKSRKTEDIHDDYKKAHTNKSVKSMSDAELRSRINRLQMEQTYGNMTRKTLNGKKIVKNVIAMAGTLAAAENAYRTYKKYGDMALNKIGDYVLDSVVKGMNK